MCTLSLRDRPIAICCTPSKILERHIRKLLVDFLESRSILPPEQYGFRAGRSVTTQMLASFDDWTTATSNKQWVDVIYFDFRKAFDRVSIPKLLHKCESVGIKGSLLEWLRSFLMDRSFRVKVGDSLSHSLESPSGVPQGSVLGPVLFIIYLIGIENVVAHDIKIRIFADDIKIYTCFDSKTKAIRTAALQLTIDRIIAWATEWQLELASNKCSVVHIGTRNPRTGYTLGGAPLTACDQVRDLGLTVSSTITPTVNSSARAKMAMTRARLLARTVTSTNRVVLMNLFKSYVLPVLDFASSVWNPYLLKDIRELERVQRYWTRIVFYRVYPDSGYPQSMPPYAFRSRILGLRTLCERRAAIDLTLAFKMRRNETAARFSQYFKLKPTRGRNGSFALRIHSTRNTVRHNYFTLRTARNICTLTKAYPRLFTARNSNIFRNSLEKIDLTRVLSLAN